VSEQGFGRSSARRVRPEDRPAFGSAFLQQGRKRALALRLIAVPFGWPLLLALIRGAAGDFLSIAGGMALLFLAARQIDDPFTAHAEGRSLDFSALRLPPKLLGALMTALAALLLSGGAAHDSPLMALVFAVLAFAGCALAYGLDAGLDHQSLRDAARRATTRGDPVTTTLAEARRKIADIEATAARLHARELKAHLARIVAQARAVLAEVERRPGEIGRARRFFATYLDGTRDVVARYVERQHDLVDTPLAANFRRVLGTIEAVFSEQQEVLRRDDKLDLEVKIEVLETQMREEGVH
jgi:prophage DNA circulation protein